MKLIGEFPVAIDNKGRLRLPTALLRQLGEKPSDAEGYEFVLNRGFEKCLTLYPQQSWDPIFSEISKLNDFDPKVREFRRYFLNGAIQLELDSAGRLLIPKSLAEHAGLERDIVLVSAINKIEIWDKSKYKEFFETFTPQAFSELANAVMNKTTG